jgi:hypothetical protein
MIWVAVLLVFGDAEIAERILQPQVLIEADDDENDDPYLYNKRGEGIWVGPGWYDGIWFDDQESWDKYRGC